MTKVQEHKRWLATGPTSSGVPTIGVVRLIRGIIFDMDGVLIDSEPIWERIRRAYVLKSGGVWNSDSHSKMMGRNTAEWSQFVADDLGVRRDATVIASQVIDQMAAYYVSHLPLLSGAVDVVQQLAMHYPLGLASSSPRLLIDTVLRSAGLTGQFAATRSTEEEDRGKPSPDVYLTVARTLAIPVEQCLAVEDSTSGLLSAASAGLVVVAIPQPSFPPSDDALRLAARVLPDLNALPAAVEALNRAEDG